MTLLSGLLTALLALVAMEGIAYLTHRFVMHGWLWRWHVSHHEQRQGWFEFNDLFAVIFALLAIVLIFLGAKTQTASYWMGWGMAGYGAIYALFHDGLVHGRIPFPRRLKQLPYLRHLVQAHYLHHATHGRQGAVSYGFLYAPSLTRLRTKFRVAARDRRAAAQKTGLL